MRFGIKLIGIAAAAHLAFDLVLVPAWRVMAQLLAAVGMLP